MNEYDLFLEAGADDGVLSLLAVSSVGVARARVTLPADDAFKDLRVRVSGKEKGVGIREQFGRQLFDAVFKGDVLAAWAKAEADPEGGRLRLVIDVPEVSTLPWELLYDGHNFLATDARLALSRYIPVPEPRTTPVVDRLSVLLATASPQGLGAIPPAEVKELAEAIRAAADVTLLDRCTAARLSDAIAAQDFHVVHYLGHGSKDALLLQDGNGDVEALPDRALGQMLFGRTATRLVVLSACSSAQTASGAFAGMGPALIRTRVPAVVAMQYEFVQLSTAQAFNRRFYAELAKGTPVDVAVNRARNEISATGDLLAQRDWSTPVLYLGTRSGRLITLKSEEAAGVGKAAQAVQAAVAKDDGAAEGWQELLKTFESLHRSYETLATLTRLRDLVRDLKEGFERIVRLAPPGFAGAEFQQIKDEWGRISTGVLAKVRDGTARLGDAALKAGLTTMLGQADAVTDGIKRIAFQDLSQAINTLRETLVERDLALATAVDDRIADLLAASERTLGRLTAND